jgi:vanillin dehydrogenase
MAQELHMRAAIDAADAAKSFRAATPPSERERILHRAADGLESAKQEIVNLLIDEGGSTFGKAMFAVPFAANLVHSIAGEARRVHSDVFSSDSPGLFSMAIQPLRASSRAFRRLTSRDSR